MKAPVVVILACLSLPLFSQTKLEPLRKAQSELREEVRAPDDISYTGLSAKDEEIILLNIDESKLDSNKDNSLWTTISNAYIRNYKKLFREKQEL